MHPKLHNNLSIYFYNRYRVLAEEIIENEINRDRIGESKRNHFGLIKEVHKRSTKTVYRLKKLHLAEEGIDIDDVTHDKREELLNKLQLKEHFGEDDDMLG